MRRGEREEDRRRDRERKIDRQIERKRDCISISLSKLCSFEDSI